MTSHLEARRIIEQGIELYKQRPLSWTERECQAVQAVCYIESNYGDGWRGGTGEGSNNWGADQGVGSAGFFIHKDTHPLPDGTNKEYTTKFAKWIAPVEGASSIIKWMLRHVKTELAIELGSIHDLSAGMYAERYYEGTGPTPAERIRRHAFALEHALVDRILPAIGKPLALVRNEVMPPIYTFEQFMEDINGSPITERPEP